MKPHELREGVKSILAEGGTHISLIKSKGSKLPPGFPRGELLNVQPNGDQVRSYDAARLLKWLNKYMAGDNRVCRCGGPPNDIVLQKCSYIDSKISPGTCARCLHDRQCHESDV